jgi:taurine dioxygenase
VRNQDLSAHQLRDLVACFGPLFVHHSDDGVIHAEGVAEVLEMRKEADGTRLFGGSDWHADVTFRKPAGYVSALQSKILPSLGGDTGFASTIAAYQALTPGFQHFLGQLTAVHSYNGPGVPDHPSETARHAVVREHPQSGAKGIYMNRMFVTRFDGMHAEESRAFIDFLDRHMSRMEFCFRHRWQTGDLVLWDNRFSLHYPVNDFGGELRSLIRCTALEAQEAVGPRPNLLRRWKTGLFFRSF